jgi:hypothetical protein
MKASSTLIATLALSFALLCAGCSMSSQVSAVSVQAADGQVVTNEWNSSSRCGLGDPAAPPCSARTIQRREQVIVQP